MDGLVILIHNIVVVCGKFVMLVYYCGMIDFRSKLNSM